MFEALTERLQDVFKGLGRRGTLRPIDVDVALGEIRLALLDADVHQRLVNTITDKAKPGDNFVIWNGVASDGRSVSSGVYFYQIKTDLLRAQKKMILLK